MRIPSRMSGVLSRSHNLGGYVDVYRNGVSVLSRLPITDGSVTEQRSANVRRTASFTVPTRQGTPFPLNVFDTVVRIYLEVGMGALSDTVPLGHFRVDDISRGTLSEYEVSCSSFESYLLDARFVVPTASPKGNTKYGEIQRLIDGGLPAPLRHPLSDDARSAGTGAVSVLSKATIAATTYWDRGRMDAIQDIATSEGLEIYTNRNGRFVAAHRLDLFHAESSANPLNQTPAWTLSDAGDGVTISVTESTSRAGIYNAVLASYKSSASDESDEYGAVTGKAPLYKHLAQVTDARSPLRWNGPFGNKVLFYESSELTSNAACATVARKVLSECIVGERSYQVEGVLNPYLEAGDVVKLSTSPAPNTPNTFIVDSVTVSLSVGATSSADLQGVEQEDFSDDAE